jgi:hypothetical protein
MKKTIRGSSPYEKRQAEKVGLAAKAAMVPKRGVSSAVGKMQAKNVIEEGERGMSISASKKREAARSPSYIKKPRP